MTSILDYDVTPLLPPDRHAYRVAEKAAHNAAVSIVSELEKSLSPRLKGFAVGIALTGLFSAYGRLLANAGLPAASVDAVVARMTDGMRDEVEHWRRQVN